MASGLACSRRTGLAGPSRCVSHSGKENSGRLSNLVRPFVSERTTVLELHRLAWRGLASESGSRTLPAVIALPSRR